MKDVQRSMFVGAHLPKELPYMDSAKTKWTPVAKGGKFSVTFDSEGKFQSLTIPSALDSKPWMKNVMKGWANIFQVNYGKYVSSGKQERAYSVMEVYINTKCTKFSSIGTLQLFRINQRFMLDEMNQLTKQFKKFSFLTVQDSTYLRF